MIKKIAVKSVGWLINVSSFFSRSFAANKALMLFGTPRLGHITEKQLTFLDTACKEEFEYDNLSIMTYRWIGGKQTILLGHGWESNAARWKRLITFFKEKDYNIIAIDAPAHGKSGGKVFNAVIYSEFINVIAKRFQPEIIIGHSIGAMASVMFQYKYQLDSVEKLILLGSPSDFSDVLERYSEMLGYNQRIRNQINHTIIDKFGQSPEAFSTAKFSEHLSSEALIVHDTDDQIIPYEDALQINKSFKKSKLITTKGLGHSLNHDSVINYIYEFLDD